MAKAVVLKTDVGVKIIGCLQCSNGTWFDAEGCFKYCQEESDFLSEHQANKLKGCSSTLGHDKTQKDWYKHRENFIDVEIDIDCIQSYGDLKEEFMRE